MKHKLAGVIMNIFVRLRRKTYSYLMDNGSEDKKAKVTKKCTKKNLNLNIIKAVQKQFKLKMKYFIQKKMIDVDSVKEFIKK